MKLKTTNYLEQNEKLPWNGQHILAQQHQDMLVVYQAYNPSIADYAVSHQKLGGSHFSYQRMSWIKPNFLWMMYRCGWASKENQERVLALWIRKQDFDRILANAAYSSFQETIYPNKEAWKQDLAQQQVRLQWDPDHDPYGNKQERRAIQLGLKGPMLKQFGEEMIQQIDDITDYVHEQRQYVQAKALNRLLVPVEEVYHTPDEELNLKLGLARV